MSASASPPACGSTTTEPAARSRPTDTSTPWNECCLVCSLLAPSASEGYCSPSLALGASSMELHHAAIAGDAAGLSLLRLAPPGRGVARLARPARRRNLRRDRRPGPLERHRKRPLEN